MRDATLRSWRSGRRPGRRPADRSRARPRAGERAGARPLRPRRVGHLGPRRGRLLPAHDRGGAGRGAHRPGARPARSCRAGSGTGLAGGAVPVGDPVVIVTTKMTRVLSVDEDDQVAWVEPGVLNLDLTRAVAHLGLHYAPDPSSQQSCSIGGNVATNSGGPHCLLYGVTSAHVLAVEVCLPDGSLALLGRARRRSRRATTCAARSSAARARWASPRASRCGSRRPRPRCARSCSTSRRSRTRRPPCRRSSPRATCRPRWR